MVRVPDTRPHAPRRTLAAVLAASLVARLPIVMVSLALTLQVRDVGQGFGVVGVVGGAYVLATGAASPLLGRTADRVGATAVLVAASAVSAAALTVLAVTPDHLGAVGLAAVAAVAGAGTPPIVAVFRAMLPRLADADTLRRMYGLEAALQESLFVLGPLAVVGLVALLSPAWALGVCAAGVLGGTVAFAVLTARYVAAGTGTSGRSALRSAGLRFVAGTYALIGVTFGALEIAVIASMDDHGHRELAGLVLASWAAGSLAGGLAVAGRGGRRRADDRLPRLLATLAVLAVPLAAASLSPVLLAAAMAVQGAAIAPTLGTIYELVPRVAPSAVLTEAFAWTTSAVFAGVALGTVTAGVVVGAVGPAAAFLPAVIAPAIGVATARAVRREVRGAHPSGAGTPEPR